MHWNDQLWVLQKSKSYLVRSKCTTKRPPLSIIPNWGDSDQIWPILPTDLSNNLFLAEHSLKGKFIVQYSGNMGRTHDLEIIIDAAKFLKEEAPQVHFLFIGWGAKRKIIEKALSEDELPNVTLLEYLPRNQLCRSLNACDVAIVSFMPGMCGVSVPSRIYNIMAAGKPVIVIAEDESELASLVREEGIGWVVSPADRNKLIMAIKDANSNRSLLDEMGKRARKAVVETYSFSCVLESYESLLNSFLREVPIR